jgi:hypothetical protein
MKRNVIIALTSLAVGSCAPCPEVECTDLVDIVFSERVVSTTYDVAVAAGALDVTFSCPFELGNAPESVAGSVRSCDGFGIQLSGTFERLTVAVSGQFLGGEETMGVTYQPTHMADDPSCPGGCGRAEVILPLAPLN